ncbi:riboflavin synthase, alpha subunit [gamma proteobacterium HTCC5015]|nr:riboflavin synthase, alpha subunit [gamma proteobacterium HTCC5015]
MFTGIIQAVGRVAAAENKGGDLRLHIDTADLPMEGVELGDSIAVNGVCLTAVDLLDRGFWADVSRETLNLTSLAGIGAGRRVNLEKAMTPTTHFGGHIVSGHVDGLGEVVSRHSDGRSERFVLRAPDELARYIAKKGSITVDGTSLTVNEVKGADFELNIVPHTLEHTIMGDYQAGSKVNLEVDVVARYLERLLLGDKAHEAGQGGISLEALTRAGFVS